MNDLCRDVLRLLEGKTLATAESCTGGGIGAALTAIPGSSEVYKGGVISYGNEVKESVLGVSREVLECYGAVSAPVASLMAQGVRNLLHTDVAVSVTGLAGPGGDSFGNQLGTVYIGYESQSHSFVQMFCFNGDRDTIRTQAIRAALQIIFDHS